VLVVSVAAFAQEKEKDKGKGDSRVSEGESPRVVSPAHQRVSGVIIKLEPIRGSASSSAGDAERKRESAPTHRLTINDAIPWADWVRDQVGQNLNASPKEQARSGSNSVATKGQPRSEESLVVIVIDPNTRIDTRFRVDSDERSKGSATPAEARSASEDPLSHPAKADSTTREKSDSRESGIARFRVQDLMPGLYVEIDFAQKDGLNVAQTLTVLRPLRGADSAAPTASDKGKATGKK
jgi:hypothetical protein